MNTIPVIFTCDNKYTIGVGYVIQSMLLNKNPETIYKFYLLINDLSESNRKKFLSFKEIDPNFSIEFLNVKSIIQKDCSIKRFNEVVFWRLSIPSLFKEKYDKVIFFDSDLIVEGDLTDYYNIDLGDNVLAGVRDLGVSTYFYRSNDDRYNYYNELGFDDNTIHNYINAGVLLINLIPFRQNNYEAEFIDFFKKHKITYLNDQDCLNVVFKDKIKHIDDKWNLQVLTDSQEQKKYKGIVIYHFAGNKPWNQDYIDWCKGFPYYSIFKKYYKTSKWKFRTYFNLKVIWRYNKIKRNLYIIVLRIKSLFVSKEKRRVIKKKIYMVKNPE